MFKEYQSKPITRKAYQLKVTDSIHTVLERDGMTDQYSIGKGGQVFKSHEIPHAGGWVIYHNRYDVYYCSDKVFRERNIVD